MEPRPAPTSRTLSLALVLLVALPSTGLLAAPLAQADGAEELLPLQAALVDAAAAYVDSRIHLFGGKACAGACVPTNEIVEYDPATGNGTVVAHLPSARSGAAVVIGPYSYVYVFGGVANGTLLDEVVRFDPSTYEVRVMNATLPSARHGAAAAWDDVDLRILGGVNASGLLSQVLRYNLTADVISVSNETLPEPLARMAVAQDGTSTYLLGGENASGPTDSILVLQAWGERIVEADARLPAPVAGAAAAWGEQNAFVFGGSTSSGPSDAISRYDPEQDRVVEMAATLPGARNGSAAAYDPSSASFYVVGGANATGGGLADVVRYHATPGAPTGLAATQTQTGIRLDWTAPSESTYSFLTGYRIYRGSDPADLTLLAYAWPPGNDTWHDETVTPGTWYYALRAYTNGNVGPQGEVANATFGRVPGEPRNLTATGVVNGVSLEWDAPLDPGLPALTEYRVYRHNESLGFVLIAVTEANRTDHADASLPGNETFRYVVTAVNDMGEGNASNEANATTLAPRAPSVPRNLTATPVAGGVGLAWEPPADDGTAPVESYQVWRGRFAGERWHGFGVPANQTWFNDTIPRGETYWYEVQASSAHGTGEPTPSVSASGLYAPTAPRDLHVASGPGQLNLTWTAPEHPGSSPLLGYRVYGGNASGSSTLLAELGNVTSWSDAPLPAGLTRHYRVAAFNAFGEGAWSTEASNATWATPSAPRNLTATGGVRQANLSWAPPSDSGGGALTEYRVHRDGVLVATLPATALSYTDTGLANGTKYGYEVSAVNAAGEGPRSDLVNATTFAAPGAPRDLAATKILSGIRLDWLAPTSDGGTPLVKYVVYRSLSSASDGVAIAEPTGVTYTDAGCPLGTICYYRVAAVNLVGEGPKSNQAWNVG